MNKKKTLTLEQMEEAWEIIKEYHNPTEILVPEEVAKVINKKYPHKLDTTKDSKVEGDKK
jgi:hypothetical protein